MGKSENLSKGIIKRIIFILIVLLLLFGVGVLATTSAVNTVTISFADKTELTVVTTKSKIEEILKENNIYIAPDESVKQGLNSNIDATKTINIVRKSEIENEEENKETQVIKTEELLNSEGSVIVEKIIKETVEIPYETIKKEVTSKEKGEKVNKVVQKGKNGKKEITYKVKYQDDVEIERHKLSEKVIQKPVNKIIEVSVRIAVSSRGTSAVRTGAGKWTYSAADLDLLYAITAQESSRSYEGALAVITTACNRAESSRWRRNGKDPLSQYKAPNQYCYSASVGGNWRRFLNGRAPSHVKKAVNDALNGKRNHSYLSFRSASTRHAGVNIGGNVYF